MDKLLHIHLVMDKVIEGFLLFVATNVSLVDACVLM
jgi:hypothetical protein